MTRGTNMLQQVARRMRHNQLIGQILPDRQPEYWVGFDQVDESVVRLLLTTGVAGETTSRTDELRSIVSLRSRLRSGFEWNLITHRDFLGVDDDRRFSPRALVGLS